MLQVAAPRVLGTLSLTCYSPPGSARRLPTARDLHDGGRAEAADACDAQPGYGGFVYRVIAAAAAALRRGHPALATSRRSGAAEVCQLPTRIALSYLTLWAHRQDHKRGLPQPCWPA